MDATPTTGRMVLCFLCPPDGLFYIKSMEMIKPREKDIGRAVIYRHKEEGTLTSYNMYFAFVRYGTDKNSKATNREDLEWAVIPEDK